MEVEKTMIPKPLHILIVLIFASCASATTLHGSVYSVEKARGITVRKPPKGGDA